MVRRDRLLHVLGQRFSARLVVVRAGAGFGKSTLLRQAMGENALDPRGLDVYVPMPIGGTKALDLPTMLFGALGGPDAVADDASMRQVIDAVWAQAPREVALIIDDLHRVEDDGRVSAELEHLLDALPANGHLVLSSRRNPPVPFRAMVARGEAILVEESELRFDHDDLVSFASLRGSDVANLGADGWPALAELRASAGLAADKEFVAEEILGAIGPDQLRALQRLVLHGRFDDELVVRCTGYNGRAADLAAHLPLTSFDGSSYLLHDLWPTMLPALPPAEEVVACVELATALEHREDLASAVELFVRAERWDDINRILLQLARDFAAHYGLSIRRRVLSVLPHALANTAAARVVAADLLFLPSPPTARHALQDAAAVAEREGNGELEALAVFRLAELAFRAAETDELQRHIDRLLELAEHDRAIASLARLARIWQWMSSDRLDEAIEFLSVESSDYAPTRAYEDFYRVALFTHMGHAASTVEGGAEVIARLPGRLAARAAGSRFIALFQAGQLTAEQLTSVTELVGRIASTEDSQLFVEGACTVVLFQLAIGDVAVADRLLAEAQRLAAVGEPGDWSEHIVAIAKAARALVANDEETARSILEAAIPPDGPFAALSRHLYLNVLAMAFFLVPRSREHFAATEMGAEGQRALAVGRALVALRDEGDARLAAALDWSQPHLIRPWALGPHLAELAVAALSQGVDDAEAVIHELRHDPYVALGTISERSSGAVATTAKRLLRTTPRRPTEVTYINALGPLVISNEVGAASGQAAPRRRTIELLALLVLNPRMTRGEICVALWPDFDERKARNNLGVNLTYLRRLLEPHADRGAESWHIATQRESVSLVRSAFLDIDCDGFVAALASARRADAASLPGTALEEYMRATALFRGELFPELMGSEIGEVERTRFRLDFVAAATRAASLLTASGRPDEAVDLSRRAVGLEPLAEGAYETLIRALDAAGRPLDSAREECRAQFAAAGLPVGRSLAVLLDTPR